MENEDNKGMWKSSVRICIGVGVILGGLWAFGIGSIFWKSYTIKRNPVYQTTMTDFAHVPPPKKKDVEDEMRLQMIISRDSICKATRIREYFICNSIV